MSGKDRARASWSRRGASFVVRVWEEQTPAGLGCGPLRASVRDLATGEERFLSDADGLLLKLVGDDGIRSSASQRRAGRSATRRGRADLR